MNNQKLTIVRPRPKRPEPGEDSKRMADKRVQARFTAPLTLSVEAVEKVIRV
jgi:hypothetical protein